MNQFGHIYIENRADTTVVLYHGTGGDEHDLLPLVEPWDDRVNILSLRGNVVEQGSNRFFARSAPGVFDQESIMRETEKLTDFLQEWQTFHQVKPEAMVHIGYSNGANMILATLFRTPQLFSAVALLHPMLPYQPGRIDLSHLRVLVTAGKRDVLIPSGEGDLVHDTLVKLGASVQAQVHEGGHEIQKSEVQLLTQFVLKVKDTSNTHRVLSRRKG